jgi:hypothetical protein
MFLPRTFSIDITTSVILGLKPIRARTDFKIRGSGLFILLLMLV